MPDLNRNIRCKMFSGGNYSQVIEEVESFLTGIIFISSTQSETLDQDEYSLTVLIYYKNDEGH